MKNEVDSVIVLVEETADALTKEIRVSQLLLVLFVLLTCCGMLLLQWRIGELDQRIEKLESTCIP